MKDWTIVFSIELKYFPLSSLRCPIILSNLILKCLILVLMFWCYLVLILSWFVIGAVFYFRKLMLSYFLISSLYFIYFYLKLENSLLHHLHFLFLTWDIMVNRWSCVVLSYFNLLLFSHLGLIFCILIFPHFTSV